MRVVSDIPQSNLKLMITIKQIYYPPPPTQIVPSYSYTIVLSGLFELYATGGSLNHEAKPSGLNACLECTIQ